MKRPGGKHRSVHARRYFNPEAIPEQAKILNIHQGLRTVPIKVTGLPGPAMRFGASKEGLPVNVQQDASRETVGTAAA
jgi:hypothetical protein